MANIFVGNLSDQITRKDLFAAFSQYGSVGRVDIVMDRDTGEPVGFAFIEILNPRHAESAISQLNGAELRGRAMSVTEALPNSAVRAHSGGGSGSNRGRDSNSRPRKVDGSQ